MPSNDLPGGETPPLRSGEVVLERLRVALRDRYTVERELGRGGMGRVFLARDLKHGRDVAIKTLHPELASSVVGQRFLQEIETAARLTHPHILGMHDSGEAQGLLFYIMPYVEGESLRERLKREGRLPLRDALAIAREVADALVYAHARGIIHRDIKPENILLLSGSHALLTDFGLARAVHTAVSRRMTPTGLAIGSPLYMSPEQARGDRDTDGRADLYSLGCVLYEMLSGSPPFDGPTAQAVLRRKLAEGPPPLRRLRPEVPLTLESVVGKAMAPAPAERHQTAEELAEALSAGFHSSGPLRRYWKSAAGAAGLLLVIAATWFATQQRSLVGGGVLREREPVLLADFQSPSGDSVLAAIVTEGFRAELTETRLVTILEPARIREALRRMQRPETTPLTPPLAREVALREGIRAMVTGVVASVGTGYQLSASISAAGTEEAYAIARETARDSTMLIPAIDRLSEELRRQMGEPFQALQRDEPLERVTTGSIDALRKYSQAVRVIDYHGDYRRGIALLEEAVAIDPEFAMAYRKLGIALANEGAHPGRAFEMMTRAYLNRSRLTDRERYLAEADYYDAIGDPYRAITAYRTLVGIYGNDRVALNNLAHVYSSTGAYDRAVEYYSLAVQADTTWTLALSNLVEASYNAGQATLARTTLNRLRRDYPDYPNGLHDAIQLAAATGEYEAAAAQARELAQRQREDVGWRVDTGRWLAALAALRGRLEEADRSMAATMEEQLGWGSRGGYLEDAVYAARLDLHVRSDTVAALRRIQGALAAMPLDSIAPPDRPYMALGRFYADARRTDLARRLLARMAMDADPALARRTDRTRRTVLGVVHLAEGRPREAIEVLGALRPPSCPVCDLPYLARAHEAAGRPDSAIAVYERYLSTPYLRRGMEDAVWLPSVRERLAALHERGGNPRAAAGHLTALMTLWRGADPSLERRRDAVRVRLERLGAASPPGGAQPPAR